MFGVWFLLSIFLAGLASLQPCAATDATKRTFSQVQGTSINARVVDGDQRVLDSVALPGLRDLVDQDRGVTPVKYG